MIQIDNFGEVRPHARDPPLLLIFKSVDHPVPLVSNLGDCGLQGGIVRLSNELPLGKLSVTSRQCLIGHCLASCSDRLRRLGERLVRKRLAYQITFVEAVRAP